MELKKIFNTKPFRQKENLEKKIEQFEKNSEKLKFLISNIDKSVFPENPLPIEEKKFQKVSPGDEVISLRARYSFIIEEGNIKEEKYEINEEELDKGHLSIGTLFNLTIHEVRHRMQEAKKREKSDFQTFTEKDFLNFLEIVPEIKSLKDYTKIQKYLEIRKKHAKNTEKFNKEIDAIIVGTTAETLFRKGENITIILETVKSDNKEKFLEIIKENKKELLESVSSKIKENFID
jgi:hypothetical protein